MLKYNHRKNPKGAVSILTTKEEKRELLHKQWEEQIAECENSNMSVKVTNLMFSDILCIS